MNYELKNRQRHSERQRERSAQRLKLRIEGASVLVVEDDEDLRSLYAAVLDFEGYRVSVAANGAEALEQIADGHYDLLLTDRQMPVLDGENLVTTLRSAGVRIPIVMLSGSLRDASLPEHIASEVAIALPKPSTPTAILAAVYLTLCHRLPALAAAA
jgi:CheY-like chemotaxis protein